MAIYGVTDTGFVRKTLVEIEESLQEKAKTEWGNGVVLDNDGIAGQTVKVMSDPLDELWQALEGVYAAQQFTGAEGLDLDNVLSTQGVYRQGKQRSTGVIEVITDKDVANNFLIPESTFFLSSNLRYQTSSTTVIASSNVSSLLLRPEDLEVGNVYTMSIVNTSTNLIVTDVTTTITTQFEKVEALENWYNFIISNKPELATSISFNKTGANEDGVLGVGYTATEQDNGNFIYNLTPLSTPIYMDLPIKVGLRGTTVPVTAEIAEYRTVEGGGGVQYTYVGDDSSNELVSIKGGITSISPTFTGLDIALNLNQFNTGADVETDAQYRFRYNQIIDQVTAATKDAVEGALLQLDDITKVRIYENVTPIDEVFADAYTFNSVCLGGDSQEIAQTIYDKKPINVDTSGSLTVNITTSNDDVVPISFSYADEVPMSIRISYKTKTSFPLSTSEQAVIASAIEEFGSSLNIGEIVYNEQIKSFVYSSLVFGRLISLTVEIKKVSEPDSAYTALDYQPLYNENLGMVTDNILFVHL